MFDAHAHLTEVPPPGPVSGWLVPGVNLESEPRNTELARDPRIHSGLGLHPWHLPKDRSALDNLLERLEGLTASRPVIAIGETGLDKGRRAGAMELQRVAFRAQVHLAQKLGLPLIIHCVRAHGACLALLDEEGFDGGGMVHDFCGPSEMIEPWCSAGFSLSISPRGMDRVDVIQSIPGDRLLIETDDESIDALPTVCAAVARARGEQSQSIARLTESNIRTLMGLEGSERHQPDFGL